jgi:hypothetical protein
MTDPCPKPSPRAGAEQMARIEATAHKFCGSCHSWLPTSQFTADSSRPDGLARACRDCRRRTYLRNRTQARLRDAKNHQARRAEDYRARFEALIAALPDAVLDRLPAALRPTPMQRRVARAAHRKRSAGLPVVY